MNKTEKLAFDWLKRKGFKDIVFQKRRSPDFITEGGSYEVKRGYRLKTGEIKILFSSSEQRQTLINEKTQILVFLEDREPFDILLPEELNKHRVRDIILQDWWGEAVIQIRCSKQTEKRFKKFVIDSDAHNYEEALIILLDRADRPRIAVEPAERP